MKLYLKAFSLAVICLLAPVVAGAQEGLSVKALRAAPSHASLYDVSFTTSEILAPDAEIRLTFPPSFDLSDLEIAGSTTINGGFTFKRDGQRVVVQRTGLGIVVPRGQRVNLQLGLIKSPSIFATAEPVRVEVLHSQKATTAKAFFSSVKFQSR